MLQPIAGNRAPEKIIFGLALALEECGSNIESRIATRRAAEIPAALERTGDVLSWSCSTTGWRLIRTAAAPETAWWREDDDLPGGGASNWCAGK